MEKKINNKGTARLFENPVLEFFTKSHPLLIWAMYLPVIIGLFYYSYTKQNLSWLFLILSFFGGVIFWTFFEYLMHRFLFHLNGRSDFTKRFIYVLHGNHHDYPRDKQRIFMPPLPSLIIAFIVFLILYLILQNYSFCFFSGFLSGYLIYGTTHYAIHAWNPPFKWAKPLWRNHQMHHYKHEDKGFGVSNFFWDKVFGTMFDLKNEKDDQERINELSFKRKN